MKNRLIKLTISALAASFFCVGGLKTNNSSLSKNQIFSASVKKNRTSSNQREVIDDVYYLIGTVRYTGRVEHITSTDLSVSKSGYFTFVEYYESYALQIGSNNELGSITITSSGLPISKIVVNAASSFGSALVVPFMIDEEYTSIYRGFSDYEVIVPNPKSSVTVSTVYVKKYGEVKYISVYSKAVEDIGGSDDCLGLETFIDEYMHMDYVTNEGYCNDEEHHYYQSAKDAFNLLNEHQRKLFTSNSAYSLEWERLSTWAKIAGDDLNYDLIFESTATFNNDIDMSDMTLITSLTFALSGGSMLLLMVLKKRRNK